MVSIGNWLFHHRNWLFPIFYSLLFIPSPPLAENTTLLLFVGAVIALLGQTIRNLTIGLVYIIRGGQNRHIHAAELHTNGLMAHVRNPLYIGNILILFGLGVASNSVLFVSFIFPLFVFFYQAIVLAEEDYLEKQFGEHYLGYKAKVNRWLPTLKGISNTFSQMSFKWQRVIVAEYNPMFLWSMGLLGLTVVHFYKNTAFQAIQPYLVSVFLCLCVLYLTARYLKKAKKIAA